MRLACSGFTGAAGGRPARPGPHAALCNPARCNIPRALNDVGPRSAPGRVLVRTQNSAHYGVTTGLTIETNKELQRSRNLLELGTAYRSSESHLNMINVATTWTRLGQLHRPSTAAASAAFARDLMGKTLATVPYMEYRHLANVFWAMGKLRLDLAAEPLGPFLAEQLEEETARAIRVHGPPEPRHAEQLWYGLAHCSYAWSAGFMDRMVHTTAAHICGWADTKAIAQACINMSKCKGRLRLDAQQTAQLEEAVSTVLSRAEAEPTTVALALSGVTIATRDLGLQVGPDVKLRACELAVSHARLIAQSSKGRLPVAATFLWWVKMGHQPTGAAAALWYDCLCDLGDGWSCEEFAMTVHALALCRDYVPPAELRERVQAEAEALRGYGMPAAMGLLVAVRAWDVRLSAAGLRKLTGLIG